MLATLKPLFKPCDVAVIGASKAPGKQGHTSVDDLLREVGAGLSNFVPVDNEADLSMLDFIEYVIVFKAQAADGYSGPVMVFTPSLPNMVNSELIADMMLARKKCTGSPVVVVALGGLVESIVKKYVAAVLDASMISIFSPAEFATQVKSELDR